jgi:P4 family phage/plasmid primase-like protien
MTYAAAAAEYLDFGWNTPIPLPQGAKYPPPEGSTGNLPDVPVETIQGWISEKADDNVGLRMPRFTYYDGQDYEVLGIDVDQYDTKNGWATVEAMIERLGELPQTWKTSSRGLDNPGGIYYFRVPAGKKWVGKLGDDVEIIQRSHRYAVAPPSAVKDRTYAWYMVDLDGELGTELTDRMPGPDDLPELPEAWQERLLKGEASDRQRTGKPVDDELSSFKSVRRWMAKSLPGYDKAMSTEMARCADLDVLRDEAIGGAHDMLVSRSHRAVMLAAEGHHGLQAAIENIQTAFYGEVLGEHDDASTRRDSGEARREVERAIGQEIEKLRQDIADEYIMISATGGYSADDVNTDISGLLNQLAKRKSRRIEMIEDYADNHRGMAKMQREYWGDDIKPIIGTADWAVWDEGAGRLRKLSMSDQYWMVELGVELPLKEEASRLYDLADRYDESDQEDDAKRSRKLAGDYERRSRGAGNISTMDSLLKVAHALPGDSVRLEDFDREPLTMGVSNGVLDLRSNAAGAVLRKGTPEDLIFENTEVEFDPTAHSPLWDSYLETFLPDKDYRAFVQKVLGYTLMGENPQRLMIFLQGGTSTGKSTIISAIERAVGNYATTVAANALFREKQDAGPAPEVLAALPKRIVFSSEIGTHHRLHADTIKRLTGGDKVSARALYSNEVITRRPSFTPVVATNSMPTIQDGDTALWRRILVLPFDNQVDQGAVPVQRVDEDETATAAVLAWLVEGLVAYLSEPDLSPVTWPQNVQKRWRTFISGTSDFLGFLDQSVDRGLDPKTDRVECSELYSLYQAWCSAEGTRPADVLTRTGFTKRLFENGISKRATSVRIQGKANPVSKQMYIGIRLKAKKKS